MDTSRAVPIRARSPPRRPRDDDFAVRPRRISLDPGDPLSRRPPSLMPPRSPNKGAGPVITKEHERPASPLSKSSKPSGGVQEVASYVIPAVSASGRNHHRHSSLTTGERLRPRERDPRERIYPGGSSRTSAPHPARENDRDYNYEYTGPAKEFLRDGPPVPLPRPRERKDAYNAGRERPASMTIPDRAEPEYRRLAREPGPPPSTRGFEGMGRAESLRQPRRAREDDADRRENLPRGYLRDEPRDDRGYPELRRSVRRNTEDEYVPYPDESARHHRPRKPTHEEDRVEGRQRPRKPTLEDERVDSRADPRSRDYDEQYARGAEDRRRRHRDDREATKEYERRRESDDKDDRERRPRDESRDKRDRADDAGLKGSLLAGGATAAAVAGAAGLATEGGRRHRQKEQEDRDGLGRSIKDPRATHLEPGIDRDSESTSLSGETRLSGAPEDEDKDERHRRRRREREREEREYREARDHDRRQKEGISEPASAEGGPGPHPDSHDAATPVVIHPGDPEYSGLREQKSYERRPETDSSPRQHRRRRPRRHHSRTRDEDSYSSASSPSSEESDRGDDHIPREPPRVVTPSNEIANAKPALPPAPPKGILKKAKDKFPEPPNPVREGVAPLDAAKKGIPPEARWTRINRRLVNPEALDQEGVRFEEYPDYVIVLKVLNQEEISRYTQKTHEIRERRRAMMGAPPGTEGETSDRS